jgi:3' exoribonuclease, RNase T-like
MLHSMIDLETLGRGHNAAIKQIGAVRWDDKYGEQALFDKFVVNVDLESAMQYGQVDASTLQWWLSQPAETRDSVWHKDIATVSLPEALVMLAAFLAPVGGKRKFIGAPADEPEAIGAFWAHATFDFPILANAYTATGIENPIHFKLCRDLRTIEMLHPVDWTQRHGTHHNALDDAEYQAINLQSMLAAWGRSWE